MSRCPLHTPRTSGTAGDSVLPRCTPTMTTLRAFKVAAPWNILPGKPFLMICERLFSIYPDPSLHPCSKVLTALSLSQLVLTHSMCVEAELDALHVSHIWNIPASPPHTHTQVHPHVQTNTPTDTDHIDTPRPRQPGSSRGMSPAWSQPRAGPPEPRCCEGGLALPVPPHGDRCRFPPSRPSFSGAQLRHQHRSGQEPRHAQRPDRLLGPRVR